MLERYGHGGDLLTASELFGQPVNMFLDYSSNMNPAGPPSCVETIFREQWSEIVRYPDPTARMLRQKIADYYKVPEEAVLIGNGAAELIDLAVRVTQPTTVAVAAPSFIEYSDNARRAGAELHFIPLHFEHRFELQVEDVSHALQNAEMIILGHPNNPTGRLIPDRVRELLDLTERTVMVDEAFIDFLEDEEKMTFIRHAPHRRNLIVVRSMTKFFAVPGIRLGFVVAHPDLIENMRRLQVHWSVNHFSQLIGESVLEDGQYIAETKIWASSERTWFYHRLVQLGFDVIESSVNYLLVKLPEHVPYDVPELQKRLGKKGILIRDASRFPGLNERFFRLAVRLRDDNQVILHTLQLLLQQ